MELAVSKTIIEFVRSIGIDAKLGEVPKEKEFLPGICINNGSLLIDLENLKYPGDILHEAGHLAVTTPAKRNVMDGNIGSESDEDKSEEMMAIAWSYAAAIHLNIDPHVVFHDDGYKGGGKEIVKNFSEGHFFGVSMLQWTGLTLDKKNAAEKNVKPYPDMIKWMRE